MLKSLYNTEITEQHCVGFCQYHKCYLSVTQLKRKECLKKQCCALKKDESHEYWIQRDRKKAQKKAGRM